MSKARSGGAPEVAFDLVVERLRLMGYGGFWVVVVTGIILTRLFSGQNLETGVLMDVFGYNNICVYFDYAPSTFILPGLWAVTLALLLLYIATHWLQMRAEMRAGSLSVGLYRTLSGFKLFEAIVLALFSTIFAVTPTGWNHTLYIHTAPFFLLQIGMVSLAMSNTLHGIKSGYWDRLELPDWFAKAAIVYCVIFAMIVAFKIPVATNAMTGQRFWAQTDTLISIASIVDKAFLVCAAIIPMMKAGYLLRYRSDDIEVVRLSPTIVPHEA